MQSVDLSRGCGCGNPSLVPRPHVQAGYETKLKPVNHVPRRSPFGGVAGSRPFCKTDLPWFVPQSYLAAVTFAMDRFSTSLLLVLALASTGTTNSSEFLLLVVPCLAWCVKSPWLVFFNANLNFKLTYSQLLKPPYALQTTMVTTWCFRGHPTQPMCGAFFQHVMTVLRSCLEGRCTLPHSILVSGTRVSTYNLFNGGSTDFLCNLTSYRCKVEHLYFVLFFCCTWCIYFKTESTILATSRCTCIGVTPGGQGGHGLPTSLALKVGMIMYVFNSN